MNRDLANAVILAQFSNLKPDHVEQFRKNLAVGFLPDLWTLPVSGGTEPAWRQLQHLVQQTWSAKFAHRESFALIICVEHYASLLRLFNKSVEPSSYLHDAGQQILAKGEIKRERLLEKLTEATSERQQNVKEMVKIPKEMRRNEPERMTREMSIGEAAQRAFAEYGPITFTPEETFPFQDAVGFLMNQNWRARFCPTCGTRVVATKERSTFCSDPECSKESRREARRKWWRQYGREQRKKSMKKGKRGK